MPTDCGLRTAHFGGRRHRFLQTMLTQRHSRLFATRLFVQKMCLRSWMDAGSLKLPANRAQAAADTAAARAAQDTALAADLRAALAQIENEQDDWYEEILDDGVDQMVNNQFEDLVFQSEFTSWLLAAQKTATPTGLINTKYDQPLKSNYPL
jgi:hypothetical protein